jgi:multiple sugar transport system ATP-binding protein
MNLVEATVEHGAARFGSFTIPLAADAAPPDGPVILGIRPESFDDAAFAPPGLPVLEVEVAVVEELGSDTHVFFPVDAKAITAELLEAAEGEDASIPGAALFTARVDARSGTRVGSGLRLAVDPAGLQFFDAATGRRLAVAAPERQLAGAR